MTAVTVAVLISAFLHASWNALAHYVPDKVAAVAVMAVGTFALCLPVLPFVAPPAGPAWPFLVTSAIIHLAYNLLLARSYRLGDFNQMYPLARGTSPLVVAMVATLFVGEELPALHLGGVFVVSAGLAALVLAGGRPTRRELPALVAATLTGLTIAGYTVVDGLGVRRAQSTAGYVFWLFTLESAILIGFVSYRYGRKLPAALRGHWRVGVCGAALSMGAYGLVLWAQTRGALAAVAALRETSVIVGAVIGSWLFRERFGMARVIATVLVATGIVLLNL